MRTSTLSLNGIEKCETSYSNMSFVKAKGNEVNVDKYVLFSKTENL